MKLSINLSLALMILFLNLAPSLSVFAQCEDEDFLDDCAAGIGDFKFLKAYKIKVKGDKSGAIPTIEYKSMFSKGKSYLINACSDPDGGKLIVSLYDRNHRLISSNFNKKTKEYYPGVAYRCTATGLYYLSYTFRAEKGGCGVSVLGFKQ